MLTCLQLLFQVPWPALEEGLPRKALKTAFTCVLDLLDATWQLFWMQLPQPKCEGHRGRVLELVKRFTQKYCNIILEFKNNVSTLEVSVVDGGGICMLALRTV